MSRLDLGARRLLPVAALALVFAGPLAGQASLGRAGSGSRAPAWLSGPDALPFAGAVAAHGGGTLDPGRLLTTLERVLAPGHADPSSAATPAGGRLLRTQLASSRVRRARALADAPLRAAFESAGVAYPAAPIYLRAFKREHELEVWGRRPDGRYALVRTYPICTLGVSGLGPKRRRGDEQVPEGYYHIVGFNAASAYLLSLRLDYPNAADRARAAAASSDPGGDIFLHGGCRSAGCLPLTDTGIEQIYWLALQARAAGEARIPIDIFPARLDDDRWHELRRVFADEPGLLAFWTQLKQGYDTFARTHRPPQVSVDAGGRYLLAAAGS